MSFSSQPLAFILENSILLQNTLEISIFFNSNFEKETFFGMGR